MANGLNFGSTAIGNLKFGSSQVSNIYLGSTLVWSQAPSGYQYVRWTCTGNSVNTVSALTEIQVWNSAGTTNLMAGLMPYSETGNGATATPYQGANTENRLTDGLFDANYDSWNNNSGQTVQLVWKFANAQPNTDFSNLDILHLNSGGRYYNFKVEISKDNTNWVTIIDRSNNSTSLASQEPTTGSLSFAVGSLPA